MAPEPQEIRSGKSRSPPVAGPLLTAVGCTAADEEPRQRSAEARVEVTERLAAYERALLEGDPAP